MSVNGNGYNRAAAAPPPATPSYGRSTSQGRPTTSGNYLSAGQPDAGHTARTYAPGTGNSSGRRVY